MDEAITRYFSDFLMASVTCLSGSRLAIGKTTRSDSNALAACLLITTASFRPRTADEVLEGAADPTLPREGSSRTSARLAASSVHPLRPLAGRAPGRLFGEAVARGRPPGGRRERDR